ncbi:hypothetical protein [Clostridium rectalis]|uniref:hypothetical protein n=1 Tax=Clostridium rectalis TaxID=2040295 RepID=UPI000F62FC9B|nr:hypothetical protein [Clostridium rectalis]
MNNNMKLKLCTPYKEYFNTDIKKIITESIGGKIEILPSHSNFITVLKPTNTKVEDIKGKEYNFSNSAGIMQVENGEIKIVFEEIHMDNNNA